MKYIVDAQLPRKLSIFLKEKGIDCLHTLDLLDKNKTSDTVLLHISESENRIIISKDADFLESYLVRDIPKKLLLIKTGNLVNELLIALFDKYFDKIDKQFNDANLIELHKTEIIIHE